MVCRCWTGNWTAWHTASIVTASMCLPDTELLLVLQMFQCMAACCLCMLRVNMSPCCRPTSEPKKQNQKDQKVSQCTKPLQSRRAQISNTGGGINAIAPCIMMEQIRLSMQTHQMEACDTCCKYAHVSILLAHFNRLYLAAHHLKFCWSIVSRHKHVL